MEPREDPSVYHDARRFITVLFALGFAAGVAVIGLSILLTKLVLWCVS